jgi:hypothetical protein
MYQLMCGDFNDFNDPVHNMVMKHGYSSVFNKIHGREARITHCNHNNREVGVDFIFASHLDGLASKEGGEEAVYNHHEERMQLVPTNCVLYPREMPDRTRLKRPIFGHDWELVNHPYGTYLEEETFVDYWKMVSDHRPLIASFDVLPPVSSRLVKGP